MLLPLLLNAIKTVVEIVSGVKGWSQELSVSSVSGHSAVVSGALCHHKSNCAGVGYSCGEERDACGAVDEEVLWEEFAGRMNVSDAESDVGDAGCG